MCLWKTAMSRKWWLMGNCSESICFKLMGFAKNESSRNIWKNKFYSFHFNFFFKSQNISPIVWGFALISFVPFLYSSFFVQFSEQENEMTYHELNENHKAQKCCVKLQCKWQFKIFCLLSTVGQGIICYLMSKIGCFEHV